jgi:hypothetical protein
MDPGSWAMVAGKGGWKRKRDTEKEKEQEKEQEKDEDEEPGSRTQIPGSRSRIQLPTY